MNVPIAFTLFRIALIPVFVVAFYLPVQWANEICAIAFALAAVTDWLDGYLARRLKQTTIFGAFLDPVADKLMVVVALVLLVQANPEIWVALPAATIIGREIAISALREWMARIGEHRRVSVVMMAKFKTFCQLAAIVLMLYGSGRRSRGVLPGGAGAPVHRHRAHPLVDGAVPRRGPQSAPGGGWTTRPGTRRRAPGPSTGSGPPGAGRAGRESAGMGCRAGPRIVPRRGNSSVGRAQPCQGWGREFESRFPLQSVSPGRSHRPGDPLRGLSGRVVMQRPAKPCTPVRFRPQPPFPPGRPRPGHPACRPGGGTR